MNKNITRELFHQLLSQVKWVQPGQAQRVAAGFSHGNGNIFNLIIGEGARDLGKTHKHQLVIIGWIQASFSKVTKYKEK